MQCTFRSWRSKIKTIKLKLFISAIITGIIIFLINPLGLNTEQAVLFASLIMTIILWATDAVHKSWSSLYLLIIFIIFGDAPASGVISFAWSNTMLLIITTQILSVGMMNSGIIDGPVENLMRKTSDRSFITLLLPYFLGVILIFIIPQAFARVLILGGIYNAILKAGNEEEVRAKQALIFNAFLGITVTYMMFPGGDIVLNHAAITFAGTEAQKALTFGNWAKWMVAPTIVT